MLQDEEEDWLYSDGEAEAGPSTGAAPQRLAPNASSAYRDDFDDDDDFEGLTGTSSDRMPTKADDMDMGRRDWIKIDTQFQDSGYREGITSGKQAKLQGGFDSGFKDVGAPIGRRVGNMRGETAAMLVWLTQRGQSLTGSTGASTGRGMARGTSGTSRASASAQNKHSEAAKQQLERAIKETRGLISDLARLKLEEVAPIDYEALQHDKEHEEEGRGGRVAAIAVQGKGTDQDEERQGREQEQRRREAILRDLEMRVKEARESMPRPTIPI